MCLLHSEKWAYFLRNILFVTVKINIIIIKNNNRKIPKITFAIPAAAAATPVKPKSPAIMEIIRNNKASFNI
jgi:hypothetical protein